MQQKKARYHNALSVIIMFNDGLFRKNKMLKNEYVKSSANLSVVMLDFVAEFVAFGLQLCER